MTNLFFWTRFRNANGALTLLWNCLDVLPDAQAFTLSNRTEKRERLMAGAVPYRNLSLDDTLAQAKKGRNIVVLYDHNWIGDRSKLLRPILRNSSIFVLSYNEWKAPGFRKLVEKYDTYAIANVPDMQWMPMPYVRRNEFHPSPVRWAAAAHRHTRQKYSDWLIEVNHKLPADKRLDFHGLVDRLWMYHRGIKRIPRYKGELDYLNKHRAPYGYYYAVCLNRAQEYWHGYPEFAYAEAIHSGAIPILHKDWNTINMPGMNVSSPEELYEVLLDPDTRRKSMLKKGERLLQQRTDLFKEMFT